MAKILFLHNEEEGSNPLDPKILETIIQLVERTAHNSVDIGSNPISLKLIIFFIKKRIYLSWLKYTFDKCITAVQICLFL